MPTSDASARRRVAHGHGAMRSTLAQRLQALESRVDELEAVAAIERLQHIYGYYLDNRMWNEVVALFTDDGEVEVGRRGVYRGRQQLRTFFFDVLGRGRSGHAHVPDGLSRRRDDRFDTHGG